MIVDVLRNSEKYLSMHPYFPVAYEYLKKVSAMDPESLPVNEEVELVKDHVFATVWKDNSKPKEKVRWEAHETFIDWQILLKGQEIIYWTPKDTLQVKDDSRAGEDIIFFHEPADCSAAYLSAGYYVIVFPDDAHEGDCDWDGEHERIKVMIKIRMCSRVQGIVNSNELLHFYKR